LSGLGFYQPRRRTASLPSAARSTVLYRPDPTLSISAAPVRPTSCTRHARTCYGGWSAGRRPRGATGRPSRWPVTSPSATSFAGGWPRSSGTRRDPP